MMPESEWRLPKTDWLFMALVALCLCTGMWFLYTNASAQSNDAFYPSTVSATPAVYTPTYKVKTTFKYHIENIDGQRYFTAITTRRWPLEKQELRGD